MEKCKQTRKHEFLFTEDLDLFVTVQLLEDTLAVLPLGKLCEEHGYTYEWTSGQKPHLTKEGTRIAMKDGKFRTSCCLGIVVKFWRQLVFCIVSVGGSFSASVPRSSAELHRGFVHHILEDEVDGQKEEHSERR